jgi:hypothetical protein
LIADRGEVDSSSSDLFIHSQRNYSALQFLRRRVKCGGVFFAFRVMFHRMQTRAAPCVAPPKRRWYKDRAAIQATKNVRAIAGYRGTHAGEQHMLAKSAGSRGAQLLETCPDSILFDAGRCSVRESLNE